MSMALWQSSMARWWLFILLWAAAPCGRRPCCSWGPCQWLSGNPRWPGGGCSSCCGPRRHAAVGLAVAGVHVNGSLAILDGQVVVVHLAVGRGAVAVEHGVGPVQLNGLGVHAQSLLELLCPHQVVSLS